MENEVEKSMKRMREKKATGGDDVPEDVLNLLGEDGLRIKKKTDQQQSESGARISLKLK